MESKKKAAKKVTTEKTGSTPKASKKVQKAETGSVGVKTLKKSVPPTELRTVKPVELKGFTKKQYQKLLDLRDSILDVMHGVANDTLKNSDSMESCLLYTSPSPRDKRQTRMPSSA